MRHIPEQYTTEEAINDLEQIIAQETSGLRGAIAEQEDRDLAVFITRVINSDAYHDPTFFNKLETWFDQFTPA